MAVAEVVSPPPAGEAPAPPAVEAASPAPVEAASPALAAEVAAEEMGPLLGACYRCSRSNRTPVGQPGSLLSCDACLPTLIRFTVRWRSS